MLISHAVFEVLYLMLIEKFVKVELGGKLPSKSKGIQSPYIWDEKYVDGEHKNKFISLVLFGGGRTDNPRYFYRKYSDFQKNSEDEVDDMALFRALQYLKNPSLARQPTRSVLNLNFELDELYNEFAEEHQQQIMRIYLGRQKLAPKPFTFMNVEDLDTEDSNQSAVEMVNNDFESVKNVISKFYDSISVKSLNEAWEHLSPSFKERVWRSEFSRFEGGYVNTRGVRNVSITNLDQTSRFIVDCVVSYEDEIEAYSSLELDSLSGMTVKDSSHFVSIINKLKEVVESCGGVNFDRIELHKLFEPAASEYIWFKCNLPVDKLEDVFSRRRTVFIKRKYICTCHKIEETWYLERIRPLATYSTR